MDNNAQDAYIRLLIDYGFITPDKIEKTKVILDAISQKKAYLCKCMLLQDGRVIFVYDSMKDRLVDSWDKESSITSVVLWPDNAIHFNQFRYENPILEITLPINKSAFYDRRILLNDAMTFERNNHYQRLIDSITRIYNNDRITYAELIKKYDI